MYRKNEKDAKLPYGFVGLKLTAENHAGEIHTSYYATKELANQYSFKHYSTGSNEDTDEEELDDEDEEAATLSETRESPKSSEQSSAAPSLRPALSPFVDSKY